MSSLAIISLTNLRFLLSGLAITIQVALLSILFSCVFGIILGSLRFLKIPYLSKGLGLIIDMIRNLPLLLIIFFTYFALPQIGVKFDIFWSSVFALSLFESAMISEIIRAGLIALPPGQMEAGMATGLSKFSIMVDILLPQAVRQTLPSVISQLIALIKDTSLATIISLPELTHNARIIYGQDTNQVFPMFIAMAFLYFIICYALSLLSNHLQARKAY